jgi:hypothetical protein
VTVALIGPLSPLAIGLPHGYDRAMRGGGGAGEVAAAPDRERGWPP